MALSPGLYERLLTQGLTQQLQHLPADLARVEPAEVLFVLARYVHDTLVRTLRCIKDDEQQILTANHILELLAEAERIQPEPEQLLNVGPPKPRPAIPLSSSALLVNAPHDHRIGMEICTELASADRVDLLCSLLKWTGQRVVRDALQAFLDRGGRMRVLTTCYMGATDRRVLDDLVGMGNAEVRVSYDTRRTRLHAKAWLFHGETGYSTAYIGSSNLSHAALLEGVEWNVRVSPVDAPRILEKFRATFDSRAIAAERRTDDETLLPSSR